MEISHRYIAYKISKAIGIIARLRHFVPLSTLNSIYRCLIQPYTTYGIEVFRKNSKTIEKGSTTNVF